MHAGIKFKMIGVPSPEEMIKASSLNVFKSLSEVSKDVLPLFKDAARDLIEKCEGDTEKALCTALAYISGYYKNTIANRSLLSGQEKQLTLELRSVSGKWQNPIT